MINLNIIQKRIEEFYCQKMLSTNRVTSSAVVDKFFEKFLLFVGLAIAESFVHQLSAGL